MPDVVGALPLAGRRPRWRPTTCSTPTPRRRSSTSSARGTFSPRALELTAQDGNQLAVPSDGWAQLLVLPQGPVRQGRPGRAGHLRQDHDGRAAAEHRRRRRHHDGHRPQRRVHRSRRSRTSPSATAASSSTTRRTSRSTRRQCVATFQLYDDLIKNYSVPGAQDVDTTRATYFAGKAAMVVWSSFLLDEMAGLRNDALPTCPECKADPAFLAKNSGIVTAVAGPDGQPAQFGEITSWAITKDGAEHRPGPQVRRVHDERGLPGLARHRARGQVPGPQGHAADPEKFTDRLEHAAGRRRHPKPLADSLPGRRARRPCGSARTRSSAGRCRRSRARCSAPRSASCPYPRRSTP